MSIRLLAKVRVRVASPGILAATANCAGDPPIWPAHMAGFWKAPALQTVMTPAGGVGNVTTLPIAQPLVYPSPDGCAIRLALTLNRSGVTIVSPARAQKRDRSVSLGGVTAEMTTTAWDPYLNDHLLSFLERKSF